MKSNEKWLIGTFSEKWLIEIFGGSWKKQLTLQFTSGESFSYKKWDDNFKITCELLNENLQKM